MKMQFGAGVHSKAGPWAGPRFVLQEVSGPRGRRSFPSPAAAGRLRLLQQKEEKHIDTLERPADFVFSEQRNNTLCLTLHLQCTILVLWITETYHQPQRSPKEAAVLRGYLGLQLLHCHSSCALWMAALLLPESLILLTYKILSLNTQKYGHRWTMLTHLCWVNF